MPEEKTPKLPLSFPLREYTTPVAIEGFYTETVDYSKPDYTVIERGTKYSSIIGANQDVINTFQELFFLRENRSPAQYPIGIRLWATDRSAEDTYNAEVDYVSNSVTFPSYVRTYTVRRDVYDASPTLPNLAVLGSVIAINMLNNGAHYTEAQVLFNPSTNGATAEVVIDQDSSISEIIITNAGSGFTIAPTIQIIGDGGGATAYAVIQGQNAFLTDQKKTEFPDDHPLRNEYVKVTQIYETLPGPWVYSQKPDTDGVILTIQKRRNISANVTASRTLVGNLWAEESKNEVDDFITEEIMQSRTIKIDATPETGLETTRVDEDGMTVTVNRVMASQTYADSITPKETLAGGIWSRISTEPIDNLRVWLITETRPIPGNPIGGSKVDESGDIVNIVRTMKASSVIVPDEIVSGGVWIKTYAKDISDLVSWEIVEAVQLPGVIVPSVKYDGKGEKITVNKRYKDTTQINPSENESGGTVTTVEKGEVSDVVSEEVTTQTIWLDEAFYLREIPDVIPEVFRAQISTTIESHILSGTASMPPLPLGTGVLMHSQKQITKLLYENRVETLGNLTFPVIFTNTENTELFGGGILNVILTLNNSVMADDTGLTVTSSKVTALGNGTWFKETRQLQNAAWPILSETKIDERYLIEVDVTKQTVAAGTTGGSSAGGNVITDVKAHDVWRSIQIVSTLNLASLPAPVQWFSSQTMSFPPELLDAAIDWAEAACGCSNSFSAALIANMSQYRGQVKTRITEQFYNGAPPDDVVITQFCPQSHNFGFAWASACGSSSSDCRTKSGVELFRIPLCLHNAFSVSIGGIVWNFPATSPAVLPHGQYVMLAPHVERWRFGIFRRLLVEALVPACGGSGGGGSGSLVFKADGSAADAYLQKGFSQDYTEVWVTFDVGFTAAALTAWNASGSGDFTKLQDLGGTHTVAGVYEIDTVPGFHTWFLHGGSSSNQSTAAPFPLPSTWQTCEMHIHVAATTTVNFFVSGSLVCAFTDASAYNVRNIRLGLYGTVVHTTDTVAYFRNLKVGTTRGGTDVFADPLNDGTFALWDSVNGTCSVVTNPF